MKALGILLLKEIEKTTKKEMKSIKQYHNFMEKIDKSNCLVMNNNNFKVFCDL